MTAFAETATTPGPSSPDVQPGEEDGGPDLHLVRPYMPESFGPGRVLAGYGHQPNQRLDIAGEWVIWGAFADLGFALCVEGNMGVLLGAHLGGLALLIVADLTRQRLLKQADRAARVSNAAELARCRS